MSIESRVVLEEINDHFNREISVIKEHINFMEMSVILTGLKDKKLSTSIAIVDDYDTSNISNIQNKIEDLSLKNKNDILVIQNEIAESRFYEIPEWFSSIDGRSDEGELVSFIYELINSGTDDRDGIMSELSNELESLCIMKGENIGGEFYLDLYDNKEKVYEYIDFTLKAYHNNTIYQNKEKLQELKNIEKLFRLIDTKNNINIYRQAFIQLVALFDAFVFDIIRIHFLNNFFVWLKLFENDTVKLHDIAECNTFDDFENSIVGKKLKSVYLKDLMNILKNHNPDLFIMDGESKYVNFIEMINRRNCHIHNNGVVDNSYLGISKNNEKPAYNIYGFGLGSYAEIEQSYFNMCLNDCCEFITKISTI